MLKLYPGGNRFKPKVWWIYVKNLSSLPDGKRADLPALRGTAFDKAPFLTLRRFV